MYVLGVVSKQPLTCTTSLLPEERGEMLFTVSRYGE